MPEPKLTLDIVAPFWNEAASAEGFARLLAELEAMTAAPTMAWSVSARR